MRPGSPLSDGLLDSLSSVCAHRWCVVAFGELQWVNGWWLPVPYAGASLLLYNVVNRAKSDVQVAYANMEFL